jgi:hypothetical protein
MNEKFVINAFKEGSLRGKKEFDEIERFRYLEDNVSKVIMKETYEVAVEKLDSRYHHIDLDF